MTCVSGCFSVSCCLQEFKKLLSHPSDSKLASKRLWWGSILGTLSALNVLESWSNFCKPSVCSCSMENIFFARKLYWLVYFQGCAAGSQLEVRYGEMALPSHIFNDRQCWGNQIGDRCSLSGGFPLLDIPHISNTVCVAEICGATSPKRKSLQSERLRRVDFYTQAK